MLMLALLDGSLHNFWKRSLIMGMQEQLMAVSPVDGRYASQMEGLAPIVSEFGLIKERVAVEAGWLMTLGSGALPDVPRFSDATLDEVRAVADEFSIEDAGVVKDIEAETNHDVKAVEVYMRRRLAGVPEVGDHLELIHFGLTSEDVTNLAYARMLARVREDVLIPGIDAVTEDLFDKAGTWADIPMLAQTHGQPATPTTLGKEMAVFAHRVEDSGTRLSNADILGKLNGASGNYNAMAIAYPGVDWRVVAMHFVEDDLGFDFNDTTTQIEPHDWMATYFNELAHGNTIMTDLARDMWLYISRGVLAQSVVAGEVGSSTMPHKVNPITFENAEANFGLANATLNHLAGKLPISRLQRDLSDSSALRAVGGAFGHTVIGHRSIKKGLGKVSPNEAVIAQEIDGEWSILAEAVQTVGRRYGIEGVYDLIKEATRGKPLDIPGYHAIVDKLDLPTDARRSLLNLTPRTYLGYAPEIARDEI